MSKLNEEWKDIKGYEGLYQVSNKGRVKSLKNKGVDRECILKVVTNRGYLQVRLCKNSNVKTLKIHRLVAEAFIPNPDNKPCIDHINTERTDNSVENLRWCTQKENMNNPITIKKSSESKIGNKWNKGKKYTKEHCKKIGESHKGKKHPIESVIRSANAHKKAIIQYSKEFVFIREWDSAVDAARELGLSKDCIRRVCNNKLKNSGGYVWKFK